MSDDKQGALTLAELTELWRQAVDSSYADPLLAAGEGRGLEAYTQALAQLARVSRAVDESTQAMFILPWSGQSAEPAGEERRATVTLTLSRDRLLEYPLRVGAGQVYFEHVAVVAAQPEGVPSPTGLRYTPTSDVIFMPGEAGPFDVEAVAERPGWGYNDPVPSSIELTSQVGSGFSHDRASVDLAAGAVPPGPPPPFADAYLRTVNEADTFVPEHVGQHVLFTSGANAGAVVRVTAFTPPDLTTSPATGSVVRLERLAALESAAVAGTFVAGEPVSVLTGATVTGWATFEVSRDASGGITRIALTLLSGTLLAGDTLLGQASAATATVDLVTARPTLTAENTPPFAAAGAGACWRVLDWAVDLGLSVTNALSPSGGRLAWLDALGLERSLPRGAGEGDGVYRQRVARVADVVTPNAVARTLNRVMGGLPFCVREVGSSRLPGFYFDRTSDPYGDAFDRDDMLLLGELAGSFVDPQAGDGFQEAVELRSAGGDVKVEGYFGKALAVPGYGFAYDVGPDGAYDLAPLGFYSSDAVEVIRRHAQGMGSLAFPYAPAAGDVLVGLSSGARLAVDAVWPNPFATSRRNSIILDYAHFRAAFSVGVPRFPFGEFGLAYDVHPTGAYDAAPYPAGYDGSPVGNAAVYQRIFQAVDKIRAGGVVFELYQEDGPCP